MVSCDFIAACSYTNESQIYILFLKRDYHSNMLQISNKIMAKQLIELYEASSCSSGYNYNYIKCVFALSDVSAVEMDWIAKKEKDETRPLFSLENRLSNGSKMATTLKYPTV